MKGVEHIQEADFERVVLKADAPVLVDFFAPWCGPCRALAPILDGIASTYEDRLKVVKLDVDECPNLADRYGIRSVPTLMVFRSGKAVDTMIGIPPLNVLRQKLEDAASSSQQVHVFTERH